MKVFSEDTELADDILFKDKDFYIKEGVVVSGGPNGGGGIELRFFGSTIVVDGTLAGTAFATTGGNTVLVGDSGKIIGGDNGIVAATGANIIENRGVITAIDTAIHLAGYTINYHSSIFNSGEILAHTGISRTGEGADQFSYHNSGLINVTDDAFVSDAGNPGVDRFFNTGDITGSIHLGGGDDLYRGGKGSLEGALFGDDGNDRIIAGADDDQIHGGYGLDRLTGGLGEDTFYFDGSVSGSGNADVITDFDPDNDMLALDHTIFGLSVGKLAAASFLASKDGHAANAGDHFLYNTMTGELLYDIDGKGGNAAQLMATLSHHPDLTAADFMVV